MNQSVEEKVARAFYGEEYDSLGNERREYALKRASHAINAFLTHQRGAVLHVGGLSIDTERGVTTLDGQVIQMSGKQYKVLVHLLQRKGEVCSYKQILRDCWGPAFLESVHYLRVCIAEIRKRVPGYVNTVNSGGYSIDSDSLSQMPDERRTGTS